MTLRDRLSAYFTTPTVFELPARNDLGSADLNALIEGYLPQSTLRVEGCTEMRGDDPVTFGGEARLAAQQPEPVDVNVTFATVDTTSRIGGTVQVGIATAPLGAVWGFADMFPSLAGTALAEVRFTSARLTLASSADALVGGYPVGFNFEGVPDKAGPVSAVDWLFDTMPSITGPIALSDAGPLIDVAGWVSSTAKLGPLTLTPGMRLTTSPGPSESTGMYADATATAKLAIGEGSSRVETEVSVALTGVDSSLLVFTLGSTIRLESYSQLDSLTGGKADFAAAAVGVPVSTTFILDGLTLTVARTDPVELILIGAQVALAPETPWPLLPNEVLTVAGLSVAFTVQSPATSPRVRVQVLGHLEIGKGPDAVRYDVSTYLPDLVAAGQLAPGSTIKLDALLAHFLGAFVPIESIPKLEIYELGIGVDVRNGTYELAVEIDAKWTVLQISDTFRIDLIGISGDFSYAGSEVTLALVGTWRFVFVPDTPGGWADFDAIASKRPDAPGWDLALQQSADSPLDLIVVVQHFVGKDVTLPSIIPNSLKIQNVELSLNTASKDYTVAGQAVATWKLTFVPDSPPLEVEAHMSIASTATEGLAVGERPALPPPAYAITQPATAQVPARTTSGSFGGSLKVGNLELSAEYQFGSAGEVVTFSFRFKGVKVWCTRTVENNEVILRGGLTGVTLGGMLEFLVDLVAPNLGFRLGPPWDALYQISFDSLTLEMNLTKDVVGFTYPIGLNLGFADVTSIGLRYAPNPAGERTVFIEIEGSFMGQSFGGESGDPLSWDALNETPPVPSGTGDPLIDLRFLALGQNVGFKDGRAFPDLDAVMNALESDFDPPPKGASNPLAPHTAPHLTFTGDNRWLIGADFTLIGAIALAGVFADPVLYGIRIELSGDKVQKLAGLKFEILYKKVTPTIGVYQIELTVPEAYRQLQFGAVSLTLPVIGLDLYTNGNFRVDLGFPAGGDFTKSFCIQAGPFIGYGGFYFAVLDGATSSRVPPITNGNFSPVIEFGVGLSVGVGRSIDKGVLKAGLTLTVEAIIEGVLAWFNPNDRALPSATFYRVEGTAAIVGKLYGSVDFVVIKADVSVVASASVTLVVEAYMAIEVSMRLSVEVSVSIKIVFFTIDFSFGTSLDLSFEIGSSSTPPWQEQAPDHAADLYTLRQQRSLHRVRRVPPARVLGELLAASGGVQIVPKPVAVFDEIQSVDLQVMPAFTVASPSSATGVAGAPEVQAVVALYVETGTDPTATGPRRERSAPAAGSAAAPFNVLARGMLRWALSWVSDVPWARSPDQIGVAELDSLAAWLAEPENRAQAFAWENLSEFIGQNFMLQLTAPVLEKADLAATAQPVAAAIFPMVPVLEMTAGERPPVRFWEQSLVSPEYERRLSTYYDQMRVDVGAGTGRAPVTETSMPGATGGDQALSTYVFSDYFAILAKGAVQAARDLYDAYPYKVAGTESLVQVVDDFTSEELEHRVGAGQTLATIAARFGVSVGELRSANPHVTVGHPNERLPVGSIVRVPAGPTLAAVADANTDYPLSQSPPAAIPVVGVKHQVVASPGASGGASQSIWDVCETYRPYGAPGPTGLFGPDRAGRANSANTALLTAGATMTVPGVPYQVTPGDALGGDPLDRIAARTYVRAGGSMTGQYAPWYAQRIADLNPGVTGTIPPGVTGVQIPLAEVGPSGIQEKGTSCYAPVVDDTFGLVARYFELIQVEGGSNAEFERFRNSVTHTSPVAPGATLGLPPYTYAVEPGESLDRIAETVGVDVQHLVGTNAASPGLLQNLGVILLPPLRYEVGPGDSLGSVAAAFDLTVAELAEGASGATGILAPYGATAGYAAPVGTMTVPHVSARDRDRLEADLLEFNRLGELSGAVSRFLLHGMRVPPPGATQDAPPLAPLYETLGQQFPGPTVGQAPYDVVFAKGPTADWLSLGPTGVPESDLTLRLGPSFIAGHQPSTELDPRVVFGPSAIPFTRSVPPRYGLQQGMHWQAGTPIAMPGPTGGRVTAGQPSVWRFPDSLTTVLAGVTGPTGPYELITAPSDPIVSAGETPADPYVWATAVPIRVNRVPGPDGTPLPNAYAVGGADQAGRDTLLDASRSPRSDDRLYLLYPPNQTSQNASGLISRPLDAQGTFVLRTNLSTVTRSNLAAAASASGDAGGNFARITSPGAFLSLVWQASVTGSGGFYLCYTGADGAGLPPALFGDGDEAVVWLLFVRGDQSEADRYLLPFNNCAVLGANVDRATSTLFAQLADPAPAQLRQVPSVPAGTVGFRLMRSNPGPGATGEPLTQSLFNLLDYRVADNSDFTQSHEALPVGPVTSKDDYGWSDAAEGATGPWRYQQLLPIARFGRVNDAPVSSALPPREANPYAGITGPTGTGGSGRPLSSARVDFAFQDVYGNRTPATPPLAPLEVPVGYIDDVIGVAAWPAAAFAYDLRKGTARDGSVVLATVLSLDVGRYFAGGGVPFAQANRTAVNDAARYERIFFQVQQRDMSFALESNVGTATADRRDLKAALTAFVTKAKLLADAASTLVELTVETTTGHAFGEVAKAYAVTPEQLATANDDLPAKEMFAGGLVIPRLVAAAPGNTLSALAKKATVVPWPPVCALDEAPSPSLTLVTRATEVSEARIASVSVGLGPAKLAERNVHKPLGMGTTLRTKARVTNIPEQWTDVTNSAAGVAAWLACPVYSTVTDPTSPTGATIEIGLIVDNLHATDLIAPDLTIKIGVVEITTSGDTTFAKLQSAFARVAPDLASFAKEIADVEGIFRVSRPVTHASLVVPTPAAVGASAPVPSWTLSDLPAGAGTADEIATLNQVVPNFFAPGTSVCLDYTCVTPGPGDTLGTLAVDHSLSVDDIATYNATTPLAATTLTLPQLTALGSSAHPYATYTPTSVDSLVTIGTLFGMTPLALADLNRELPGVLASGASLHVEGDTYVVEPLGTLDSLFARCRADHPQLTWETFVDAVASQAGALSADGASIVPLPVVPEAAVGKTPRAIAASFGLQREDSAGTAGIETLFRVNRSLQGFLSSGASIAASGGETLSLGTHDTIETVIRRFRDEQQLTVTVADLSSANADSTSVLTAGRRFLLPPVPTSLISGFEPTVPPPGATGERAVIFPVTVEVQLERSRGLVPPELRQTDSVATVSSRLTPLGLAEGESEAGLRAFATRFEDALAPWSVKCAVSKAHSLSGDRRAGQVWAVNFGASGISRMRLETWNPAFYLMTPLSTSLTTADVQYYPYESGCGLGQPVTKRFESVDVDAWMRSFLETVDLYLSTPYAVPSFEQTTTGPTGTFPDDGMRWSVDPNCNGCTGPTGPPYGPADFDRIVHAKDSIAQSLSQRVAAVLPQAAGPATLATAQETLRQQLLVRLSAAYEVDAILEFPVDVVSPWSSGMTGIPPRVSGPVVPNLVSVGGKGSATLTDVAKVAGVSASYLAALVRDVRGLLATGMTITYETRSHHIVPEDTVATVAAGLGVTVDFSDSSQWAAWVELVEGTDGIGGQPMVHAATGFPIAAVVRAVDGRSLGQIAQFAGTDVASVARANQDVPNLFVVGRDIKVGSRPRYRIQAGDTIWTIASQRIDVTVDALADAVRDDTGLLAGPSIGFATLLPKATFSTAKVPAGLDDGAQPNLSVMVSLGDQRRQRNVFFDLTYFVNELEYGIQNVPGVTGYQESSWLTFPLPIGAGGVPVPVETRIPQVQVPLPLRSYPDTPILTRQLGLQSLPGATGIDDAKLWDYAFDFERRAAAQDTTHVDVTFEHGPSIALDAVDSTTPLLSPLATFSEARPALMADLAELAAGAPGAAHPTGARAAQVLSCICEWMSSALEYVGGADAIGASGPTYEYTMETAGDPLRDLALTLEREGPRGAAWPEIWIESTTGWTGGTGPFAGYVELQRQGTTGATRDFIYPPDVSADTRLTHRFSFERRDVIQDDRGYGGVWLTRNDRLIAFGPLGVTGPGNPYSTNRQFVYGTPRVRFVDPLIPTLSAEEPIDVAGLSGGGGASLETHLTALFTNLFELPSRSGWVQLTCAYAFPTAGDDTGVWVRVPIRLLPTTSVSASSVGAVAGSLAESIDEWRRTQVALRVEDGRLNFDVVVFTVAGADGGFKPVLQLSNLFLELVKVHWP